VIQGVEALAEKMGISYGQAAAIFSPSSLPRNPWPTPVTYPSRVGDSIPPEFSFMEFADEYLNKEFSNDSEFLRQFPRRSNTSTSSSSRPFATSSSSSRSSAPSNSSSSSSAPSNSSSSSSAPSNSSSSAGPASSSASVEAGELAGITDPYQILGLTRGRVDLAAAKKAFKDAALKYHPDKGGNEEDFKKIIPAFAQIKVDLNNKKGGRRITRKSKKSRKAKKSKKSQKSQTSQKSQSRTYSRRARR
jgi:hypothetical protein